METVELIRDNNPGVIYDLARTKLTDQLAFGESVETKLGLFMSVGSGLLAVLAAVVVLRHPGIVQAGVLIAGAASFAVLACYAIPALWLTRWALGPSDDGLISRRLAGVTERETLWEAVARYRSDYEANNPVYRGKRHALNIVLVCFTVETAIVYVGTILTVLQP